MRILHLVHQYLPAHVGGTELYTQSLAKTQAGVGHSAAIFYPSDEPVGSLLPSVEEAGGVRLYGAPAGPRSRTRVFFHTFVQKPLELALAKVLKLERPDVVHVQHLMGMPFRSIDQIEAAGIPFVVTLHDYWYACANAQLITNDDSTICDGPDNWYFNCSRCALARAGKRDSIWLSPLIAPIMGYRNYRLRQILRRAGRIIAPTEFVRQTYLQMGLPSLNMVVIPHGIDVPLDRIAALRKRRQARPAGELHAGYVGSLAWQKGLHHLIAAFNELPHEGVSLTVYGDTTAFPAYVEKLRDSVRHPGVRFAGRISRDQLWQVMADFDVMVMPTIWYEASPLTIQEAHAVGVPLIASRIGAMSEKITDGVDGILVTPGDPAALRNALHRLLVEKGALARLQAGIKPVYTIYEQAKEIVKVYEALLEHPGRNG